MKHYVYKITDQITGEFYIGSRSFRGNINEDDYMGSYRTWTPVDKDRLVKEVIKDDFNSREDAIDYEANFISDNIDNELNRNYNIPNKGFHLAGKSFTEEHKEKISISNKSFYKKNPNFKAGKNHPLYGKSRKDNPQWGRKRTKEQCENISNSLKGRTLDEKTRQKISKSHKGKKLTKEHIEAIRRGTTGRTFSEDHKNKISESHKKWHRENDIDYSGKNNPNSKKVIHIETGIIFETMKDASNYNNSSVATIRNHCQEKIKNPKFKYIT